MKFTGLIAALLLVVLAACGNGFTWLSRAEAADSVLPVITAQVNGTPLVAATANSVSLPATVIFTANAPATIYYTTNGTDPTTATTTFAKIDGADDSVAGPTITSPDYILVTLGEDANGNLTGVQSYIFTLP